MVTSSCKEIFGERLRDLRIPKGMSQQALCSELNISKAALSYYENGQRSPDIDILLVIANFFNVSADYLLGRTKAATTDVDLKGICDFMSLSEKAVEKIALFTEFSMPVCCVSEGAIFNKLCENDYLFQLCQHFYSYYEITDLIAYYYKIIQEKKHNNEDYSEYEELLKQAQSDRDYFKWHTNDFVNKIEDYIVEYFSRGSAGHPSNAHESIESIIKRHKKIRTDWLEYYSDETSYKNNNENKGDD